MPVSYRPRKHSRRRARTAEPAHPRQPALRPLATAISALLLGGAIQAQAQSFPDTINLGSLDGGTGFKIDGEAAGDYSGFSVSAAGDINGDGIGDLIIGAPFVSPGSNRPGRAYVVFGDGAGFSSPLQLSKLDGTNGFVLDGAAEFDQAGFSVSAAGDINDDGIDDLLIGARTASRDSESQVGASFVVFGGTAPFNPTLELSALSGSNGFQLVGEDQFDRSGRTVSRAGDINNDGIDDLIIGAASATPNGGVSGRSYVVFGRSTAFSSTLQLSELNGANGFKLDGEAAYDQSGRSVSAAGDINGDGIDDLIIGAPGTASNGPGSGRTYIVFGSSDAFLPQLQLSTLNGSNGFVIDGEAESHRSGYSVSAAGDINGDGIDDVLIGAPSPYADVLGQTYVVFGKTSDFGASVQLSALDGGNGVKFEGEALYDASGYSVSNAGDINGDGIDDLVIGAPAYPGSGIVGRSYVIFGRSSGFESPLPLSALDGSNGFKIDGETPDRFQSSGQTSRGGLRTGSGRSVSAAGDINGDGIDDVIIGSPFTDANGTESGRSYVIFGRASISDLAITKTNGVGFVSSNEPVTYFIDVVNVGAVEVLGATLTDALPTTLDAGTASWTCTGSAGAVCPNASGSGNISETIALPVGGMLSFELTVTVLATEGMIVTNTATVALPSGLTDINPTDNSASDSDSVGLFADGFENN